MATIGVFPPDDVSLKAMHAAGESRVTPGVVSAFDGPTRGGPEAAGALTLLHTTFADNDGAQRGYRNFAAIKSEFRNLPGFLRWLVFNDGPHGYALGLWRSPDDVLGFTRTRAHQAMVTEQRQRPFEYSQFSGVWVAHNVGRRRIHCEQCGHATTAPAAACESCGNALDDPYLVR